MSRLFLKKSQRIVSAEDFQQVLSHKFFCRMGIVRLYWAPNALGYPRFGVSVSKSCGRAVDRNRLKRYAREAFRLHQHEIPTDYDYILIFSQKMTKIKAIADEKKTEALELNFQDVEGRFLRMVQTLRNKKRQNQQ